MLYQLEIEEIESDHKDEGLQGYASFVFEAPEYTLKDDDHVVNPRTQEWVKARVYETSVIWGFVPVAVTLSRYFPARVGFPDTNGSCVQSVLQEWTHFPTKEVAK